LTPAEFLKRFSQKKSRGRKLTTKIAGTNFHLVHLEVRSSEAKLKDNNLGTNAGIMNKNDAEATTSNTKNRDCQTLLTFIS